MPLTLRARISGFTMVEFMIAITLSLIVTAALSAAFVSSMRARDEVERSNQQIENGRYALDLVTDDLRLAGYYAEYDIQLALGASMIPNVNPPDPCTTSVATPQDILPYHIQGADGGAGVACITDARANSDVVVIRRVSTCVAGTANCPMVAGAPYFQAALCNTQIAAQSVAPAGTFTQFSLSTNPGALTRRQRNCTAAADRHRYITHIYYVANNDQAGDGVPTLKRMELRGNGFGDAPVPLVNGIETMQIEYGIDTSATPDGIPEVFTADPGSFGGCAGTVPPSCGTNWQNVVAVRMGLLARATSRSPGYVDSKEYVLGYDVNGDPNVLGPFNDAYKRHAFQSSIRLNNPASRRAP